MKWGFEDYTLDAEAFEIRKGDEPLSAEPQVLSLLILLVENRGKLLKKDDIIDSIWNGRAISDAALSSRVKSARQLIGDNGRDQRLIKTVYGNGLRFVGDVEQISSNGEKPNDNSAHVDSTPIVPAAARGPARFRLAAGIVASLAAIAVLALVWLYLRASDAQIGGADGEIVVAVVPFTSSDEQAFATELSAILVTRLSDRSDFSMMSSTSSFSLAERGMTAAQIAKELGATHILEGEVRGSGDLRSIDLRLIEGAKDQQIWSYTVQSAAEETNLLVDMAVRHSAAAIQAYLEVGAGRVDIPSGAPQDAIRDYRVALQADLAYYRRQTQLNKHQSFDSARQKAPNWADAHGAFAWVTLFTRPEVIALESDEQLALVRESYTRALEIDPNNRWGRLAQGVYQTRYGSDYAQAIQSLEELVSDEQHWPLARRMFAQALLVGGHYREAVAQFEQIDALNDLPTWQGGFLRSFALRGIGRSMNNALLAQSCEAQCFWIFSSWYDAILIKPHKTQEELESDLARLTLAMAETAQDRVANKLGQGEDVSQRMVQTALFLKGYGPKPNSPYGRSTVLVRVALKADDKDAAFDELEVFLSDWIPATAVFELLYDDALSVPDAVRADPRYHAIFSTERMEPLVQYREARNLNSGLPIEE